LLYTIGTNEWTANLQKGNIENLGYGRQDRPGGLFGGFHEGVFLADGGRARPDRGHGRPVSLV